MKTKPFNLETYKPTDKVVTNDGRKARIICTNMADLEYPVVALIQLKRSSEEEVVVCFDENGNSLFTSTELLIVIKTKTLWYCSYRLRSFPTGYGSSAPGVYKSPEEFTTKNPSAEIIDQHTIEVEDDGI